MRQPEKQVDIQKVLQKYPQNADNAGKTIKSGDNWLVYDEQGRVTNVFDHNPSRDEYLKPLESFWYGDGGSLISYATNVKDGLTNYSSEYDDEGNLTTFANIKYDTNGNQVEIYSCAFGDQPVYYSYEYGANGNKTAYNYDADGNLYGVQRDEFNNGHLVRTVRLNSDGKVESFHDKTYDDLGRTKRNTIYNSDGTVHQTHITKYKGAASYFENTKYYRYDSKGNLLQ